MTETRWISVTSHRARQRLEYAVGGLGPEYGRWTQDHQIVGEYYEVAAASVPTRRIPGVTVLRSQPQNLFKRISYR